MKIPLFDAHCDTALYLSEEGKLLKQNDCHIDLIRAAEFEKYAQFFAVWGVPQLMGDSPYADIYKRILNSFLYHLNENNDTIILCRTGQESETATQNGKMAAFISVEGADLLDCNLDNLEEAFEKGVRSVAITWNFDNRLSGANGSEKGLTRLGKEFVRRMQELGMLVDVSHISDKGFWDIMDITSAPVVATHSNSRSVWHHNRNLTDDMFRHISQTGGVAGVNLYTDFIGGEGVDVEATVAHMEHFLSIDGEKSLAIGGDLDGAETLPAGICGVEDVHKIYDALMNRGYPKSLLDDIFYNNLLSAVKRGVK